MHLPRPLVLTISAMPVWAIQRTCGIAFDAVLRRHPTLFDRLGEYGTKRYVFEPTDLPFAFEVLPATRTIMVRRTPSLDMGDASVSGPLPLLLALLEGRIDGDAVFFSRDLEISGDTEAVLALRNALDDSELDLPTDLSSLAGPFRVPLRRGLERIRSHLLSETKDQWN